MLHSVSFVALEAADASVVSRRNSANNLQSVEVSGAFDSVRRFAPVISRDYVLDLDIMVIRKLRKRR